MHTYEAPNADQAMRSIAYRLLHHPEVNTVQSRAGETREDTMVTICLNQPQHREILSSTRKASVTAQIAETMWVLSGRADVAWLSHYLPRAADFSDDGRVWRAGYGPRLRHWQAEQAHDGAGTDQLAEVVRLLRADPTTRRAVMFIFDPGADYGDSKDIPCNNWLHFLARDGVLDLHVATRSNDLIWGWSGINAFEWSVLLEVVAGLTGLRVGQLYFSISSLHIYARHYKRAAAIVGDSTRVPPHTPSPRFLMGPGASVEGLDALIEQWFVMEEGIRLGKSWPSDKDIDSFPEPMMRSWLRVIRWWWTGREEHLRPLAGTRLRIAALNGLQPPQRGPVSEETVVTERKHTPGLVEYASQLHAEKHAVYGDSWKRRGEILGIQANIARKVDRLGVPGAGDTDLDTAVDLLVYVVKYLCWLAQPTDGSEVERVEQGLSRVKLCACSGQAETVAGHIAEAREVFEALVTVTDTAVKYNRALQLAECARYLAQVYWDRQQWAAGNAARRWAGYGEE